MKDAQNNKQRKGILPGQSISGRVKVLFAVIILVIIYFIFLLYCRPKMDESAYCKSLYQINQSDKNLIKHISAMSEKNIGLYNLVCLADSHAEMIRQGIENKKDIKETLLSFNDITDSIITHYKSCCSEMSENMSFTSSRSVLYHQVLIKQMMFQKSILDYLLVQHFMFSSVKPVVIPMECNQNNPDSFFGKVYLAGQSNPDSIYLIINEDTIRQTAIDDAPVLSIKARKSRVNSVNVYYSFYHTFAGRRIDLPVEIQNYFPQ